jgi:hypothetical protein
MAQGASRRDLRHPHTGPSATSGSPPRALDGTHETPRGAELPPRVPLKASAHRTFTDPAHQRALDELRGERTGRRTQPEVEIRPPPTRELVFRAEPSQKRSAPMQLTGRNNRTRGASDLVPQWGGSYVLYRQNGAAG